MTARSFVRSMLCQEADTWLGWLTGFMVFQGEGTLVSLIDEPLMVIQAYPRQEFAVEPCTPYT